MIRVADDKESREAAQTEQFALRSPQFLIFLESSIQANENRCKLFLQNCDLCLRTRDAGVRLPRRRQGLLFSGGCLYFVEDGDHIAERS